MSALRQPVDPARIRLLNPDVSQPPARGPVYYWMHREHRLRDNWSLLHAEALARERKVPLTILYCLAGSFLGATWRQFGFLLKGLAELERDAGQYNIGFVLLRGNPEEEIPKYLAGKKSSALVTDFDTLRLKRGWVEAVARRVSVPVHEVDSRNVVPCREVSDKREYAARTLRPKIHRLLPEFLHEFPALEADPHGREAIREKPLLDWEAIGNSLAVDRTVAEVDWLKPGERAARQILQKFLEKGLDRYAAGRNDPNQDVLSNLSPYLHFGMISAQRAALEATRVKSAHPDSKESFLEELVVRRELADNFCFHTPAYDTVEGFPEWARKTLDAHREDERPYIYTQEALEAAETHDPLWNAAQDQMRLTGKMHGYLRMYWAKKILEWTVSPEEAMRAAVYLNDRYSLDGREANGYTGIAWSVGGVHDRPWKERPIFGMVRYMNAKGARKKFNVQAFIDRIKEKGKKEKGGGEGSADGDALDLDQGVHG